MEPVANKPMRYAQDISFPVERESSPKSLHPEHN